MREIKFRAWDIKNQRMVYNPYYFDVSHYSDENRVNQQAHRYYEDWRDLEDGRGYECELMQYSGLKDKNSKEIYEGDIVKCFHDGDAVGNYDIIEYNPGAFCFRYRFTTILQWVDFDGNMEVIGNIYENPELLKDETKS